MVIQPASRAIILYHECVEAFYCNSQPQHELYQSAHPAWLTYTTATVLHPREAWRARQGVIERERGWARKAVSNESEGERAAGREMQGVTEGERQLDGEREAGREAE